MLAHQGGWDEMLLVAVPILVMVLLLRMANRRASRDGRNEDAGDPSSPDRPPPTAGDS